MDRKKKTILFLEDEEELLLTVGTLLDDQGYEVTGIVSAEEALRVIKDSTPDLILADIKLPGLDGLDFYKEIRNLEQCRTTPFVFLTAFNNLQAAREAKRQGAAEYITKPFDFEYLVSRVRALVPP
ncbi:MAG: response regulator [Ignavibacteria bacterium]|nr:response regulator [Ignavibacteria bacterium]MBI3766523.1 response regulator [Ignavibacteriales bacterium]